MNSTFILPWTTPGTIGLILGTGFAGLSFSEAPLLLVIDFAMYYPFFKVYDAQLVEEEAKEKSRCNYRKCWRRSKSWSCSSKRNRYSYKSDKELSVLVLCASGATSSMLANSISKVKAKNIKLESIAMAYGQHKEVITDYDLIIWLLKWKSMYMN